MDIIQAEYFVTFFNKRDKKKENIKESAAKATLEAYYIELDFICI